MSNFDPQAYLDKHGKDFQPEEYLAKVGKWATTGIAPKVGEAISNAIPEPQEPPTSSPLAMGQQALHGIGELVGGAVGSISPADVALVGSGAAERGLRGLAGKVGQAGGKASGSAVLRGLQPAVEPLALPFTVKPDMSPVFKAKMLEVAGIDPIAALKNIVPTQEWGKIDQIAQEVVKAAGPQGRKQAEQKLLGMVNQAVNPIPKPPAPEQVVNDISKTITEPKLFLSIGEKKYPVSSIDEAKSMWNQARDTAMRQGASPDDVFNKPIIVNESGKTIGHISWNGRAWEGEPKQWEHGVTKELGTPEPSMPEPAKPPPPLSQKGREMPVKKVKTKTVINEPKKVSEFPIFTKTKSIKKQAAEFEAYKNYAIGKKNTAYGGTDEILDIWKDKSGTINYKVKDIPSGQIRTHATFIPSRKLYK